MANGTLTPCLRHAVSQGGGLCNLPLPKYNTAIAKWQSERVSTIRLNRLAAFNALN